eukprot:3448185-Pleurochrysis_carterae.AAC.1
MGRGRSSRSSKPPFHSASQQRTPWRMHFCGVSAPIRGCALRLQCPPLTQTMPIFAHGSIGLVRVTLRISSAMMPCWT